MAYKLLACPKCTAPAEHKTVPKPFQHGWVGCPRCKKYFQWVYDPQNAINQWNAYAQEGKNDV